MKQAKDFIKEKQNDILLNEYSITDMIWFMKEYSKYHMQRIKEELLSKDMLIISEGLNNDNPFITDEYSARDEDGKWITSSINKKLIEDICSIENIK